MLSPIGPQPFPTPVTDEELHVVAALPRLRSLDTRGRSIRPSAFAELLQRPALSGLTALYTGRKQLDSACTALLPLHQSALRILHVEAPGDAAAPGFFAPLPLLPALTDLSVVSSFVGRDDVRAVAECAGLRHLSLDGLVKEDWPPILTAPALRRLESLTLRGAARSDDSAYWADIFSRLPALRSLILRRCYGAGTLLPGVASQCASLRTLRISPEDVRDTFASSPLPTVGQLAELLAALPAFTVVELELPPQPLPSAPPAQTDVFASLMAGVSKSFARTQRDLQAQFAAFQQAHPQRVRLLVQEEGRD